MPGALSTTDLDSLLRTLHPASAESTTAADPAEIRSARDDFRHPELFSRDQIRTLRNVHEGFAKGLAKKLSTELRTSLSASVDSVEHWTYAEFLGLLPDPAVLSLIDAPELEGRTAIEIDPAMVLLFIDRLLGGTGSSLAKVRPLTAIEQSLLERILSKCCAELSRAWSPLLPVSFELRSIESNPELAHIVEPNEMVVLITFGLRMNEASGTMSLCLPHVAIEPLLRRLGKGPASAHARTQTSPPPRRALEQALAACPVSVDVELARLDVSLRELLDLRSGDVLPLGPLGERGASASLQGLPRFEGKPGRSRGRWAFQVLSKCSQTGEAEGSPHDLG